MIDNLTTVKYDGNWYLCEFHEDENHIELRQALKWDDDGDVDTIKEWITQHNLSLLSTIRLGLNSGYAVKSCTVNQKRLLKHLWEDMQEVKRTSIQRLENSYFLKERFQL